jgi:hypothetical protein
MPPYDEVDYGKNADGETYLRDTPRTWGFLTSQTDEAVRSELEGKPPGGGFASWNEKWVKGIEDLRSGYVENPEKYIDYIIEERREAGLREIVFPSEVKREKND